MRDFSAIFKSGLYRLYKPDLNDIYRTSNPLTSFVENMCIDHRCADIFMPHQFLNCTDIVPSFKQMGRKTVTEGMAADSLYDAGTGDSLSDRPLQNCFMHVMTALFSGFIVFPALLLRKNPLPRPLPRSFGILGALGVFVANLFLGYGSFLPVYHSPPPKQQKPLTG